MKTILAFLFVLSCASLRAQAPVIDYLQVDEAKSQLWVIGKFGVDSGSVTIEDTTLGIVSWSDTMIVCGLPDSGRGAGGAVTVKTVIGLSNQRMLSIFYLQIYYARSQLQRVWFQIGSCTWHTYWRADISPRSIQGQNTFRFEVNKLSVGTKEGNAFKATWADSSKIRDTSISVSGTIDLRQSKIFLEKIYMGFGSIIPYTPSPLFLDPKTLEFDSTGYFPLVVDSVYEHSTLILNTFTVYTGKILFPPHPKSNVQQLLGGSVADPIEISYGFTSGNQTIGLEATKPLGEVTASLFSIDGRLLRKAIIDMETPGSYKFDATGIDHQIGLLIFQTKNGCIAKKILF